MFCILIQIAIKSTHKDLTDTTSQHISSGLDSVSGQLINA